MKKFGACLVSFLLVYVGFDAQVSSAASAGGKCSKTGKTVTVGTARLVCVAAGRSKTWMALDSSAFKAPVVTSVAIAPSSTLTYYLTGQIIHVVITFDSAVLVTGVPQIYLDSGTIGKMSYVGGSGSQSLLFSYITMAGDVDSVGFGLKANSLVLNGGTINSTNGTPASLTHPGIAKATTRKLGPTAPTDTATATTIATATTTTVASTATTVATTTTTTTVASSAAPTISTISFKEPGGKWVPGQNIQIRVVFNAAVVITGSPYISVLSDAINKLTYLEGSGGTSILFSYTVVSGDIDNTGLGMAANSFVLNGGTIKSSSGVTAVLTHSAIARADTRKIAAS